MKIIITEEQFHYLKNDQHKPREVNHKPAEMFDRLYGTSLSKSYDFSPYTEDDVWNFWLDCRNDGKCENFMKVMGMLKKLFPYIDVSNLTNEVKKNIVLGMVSGLNPEDIYYFSILGIFYENNIEQKNMKKEIPHEIAKNILWVLSPNSINIIREKFAI
jgi:hypothetical protein